MISTETNTLGAYDAKTHFSELLARVEAGEEFTITKHGSPVARLVPMCVVTSESTRRGAVDAMRELASRNRLDGLHIEELIAEGRR